MKRWLLLFISVGLLLAGTAALRVNANSARAQRDAILAKDQRGEDVAAEVSRLERFSRTHMNADISFTLEGKYQRDTAAAIPQASGEVYAQAQAACAGQRDSILQARCVSDFVAARLNPGTAKPVVLPNKAAYAYNFASPEWAPDLAGLGLGGGLIGLLTFGWLMLFGRRLPARL